MGFPGRSVEMKHGYSVRALDPVQRENCFMECKIRICAPRLPAVSQTGARCDGGGLGGLIR